MSHTVAQPRHRPHEGGALAAVAVAAVGWPAFGLLGVLPMVVAAAPLVAAAAHDATAHRVPNQLVASAVAWFAAAALPVSIGRGDPGATLVAVAAGAGTLLGVTMLLAITAGLGMGDVKLATVLGAIAGWAAASSGLAHAAAAGAALSVLFLASVTSLPRARRTGTAVPFGPALVGATAAVVLGVGVLG